MIATDEQRMKRLAEATASQKELFGGEASGHMLYKIFSSYHLRPELYREYALAFGDAVLGFEDESRMPQLLVERVGLPEKLATLIAHDLLEFINTHKSTQPPLSAHQATPTASSWKQVRPEVAPQGGRADAVPQFIENAPPVIPTYRKPLTDTPKYTSDPYHENPS